MRCASCGKVKKKIEPEPRLGFHPDVSAVPLHDALADGEANAGARVAFQ
jgi:hypothetical protein